jgi:hypothetical protein
MRLIVDIGDSTLRKQVRYTLSQVESILGYDLVDSDEGSSDRLPDDALVVVADSDKIQNWIDSGPRGTKILLKIESALWSMPQSTLRESVIRSVDLEQGATNVFFRSQPTQSGRVFRSGIVVDEFDQICAGFVDTQLIGVRTFLFDFDILFVIFFFISHSEERFPTAKDRYDRPKYDGSTASILLAQNPAPVDGWLKTIESAILENHVTSTYVMAKKEEWPGGACGAVFLTHDLDHIEYPNWRMLAGLMATKLIRRNQALSWKALYRQFLHWGKRRSSLKELNELLEIEASSQFVSTFFFLGGRVTRLNGPSYRIEGRKSRAIMKAICLSRGEIGIHGSFSAAISSSHFLKELAVLRAAAPGRVTGNRMHYLRYLPPFATAILEAGGMAYDSSIGFSDRIGRRAGIGFPYEPYNWNEERAASYLELPIMIMDSALVGNEWANRADIAQEVDNLVSSLLAHSQLVSLLWHFPRAGIEAKWNFMGIYSRLLETCKANGVWSGTGSSLTEWWKARSQTKVSVSLEHSGISIEARTGTLGITNLSLVLFVGRGLDVAIPACIRCCKNLTQKHYHVQLPSIGPHTTRILEYSWRDA